MKRLGAMVLLFCACLGATAWAQAQAPLPRSGKHAFPAHGIYNKVATPSATTAMPTYPAPRIETQDMKVWDLGAHPGGTSAFLGDINDLDVLVGSSTLAGNTLNHPMMIQLFGPNAMQWVDLGTLGGEGAAEAFGASDTGTIVGYSTTSAGNQHAFVWTSVTGMVDLGTLPNLGHTDSRALDVNRIGTLIVGWSGGPDTTIPVVWTPTQHGRVTTWTIHRLPTSSDSTGRYSNGSVTAVNNLGQVVGNVWGYYGEATMLWTPRRNGKGWKLTLLLGSAEYPNVYPADLGEVVGGSYTTDWSHCVGALWRPAGATYTLTQLANPWGLSNGDWGVGINSGGDIVGAVIDENGNAQGALWSTQDPAYVELIPPLPDQTWSYLANVNELGIASGGYGGVGFMHGLAVQFH
jgi:probable HAF family extracellular repeat protein